MMRKIVFVLLLVLALAVPASAVSDELYDENTVLPEGVEVVVNPYGDAPAPATAALTDPLEDEAASDESAVVSDGTDTGVDVGGISTMSIAPVTSADSSGLKAALLGILGDYDAIIVEYSSGNYTSREVFQDDVWICSFWLLAIVIYCLFKLLGGWLCSKK